MSLYQRNVYLLRALKILKGAMFFLPTISLFYASNGLSTTDLFIVQALFSVAMIFFEIPSGYFADRLGTVNSIRLGCFVYAFGYWVYAFSFNFTTILIAELLLGIGLAFVSGADSALLYDSLMSESKEGTYKKELGKQSVGFSVSEAGAALLGGFLAALSLRLPLYVQAVVMSCLVPLSLFLVQTKLHKRTTHRSVLHDMAFVVHDAFKKKAVLGFVLHGSIISASTLTMVWFVQPYLTASAVPIVYFGAVWAVINLSVGFFALYADRFEKLCGLNNSLLVLSLAVGVSYILLGTTYSWVLLPLLFVFAFTRSARSAIVEDYLHARTESSVRATILSVNSMLSRLIFAVCSPFLGYMADAYTLGTALTISGIFFTVLGSGAFLLYRTDRAH